MRFVVESFVKTQNYLRKIFCDVLDLAATVRDDETFCELSVDIEKEEARRPCPRPSFLICVLPAPLCSLLCPDSHFVRASSPTAIPSLLAPRAT